jgi:hypothetical protein
MVVQIQHFEIRTLDVQWIREDIKTKKNVSIRALPELGGGGVLPLPEFF